MDVPKSDLGDVIAWSPRGWAGGGGEEGIKATVMMKHFLFNDSGEMGFLYAFLFTALC